MSHSHRVSSTIGRRGGRTYDDASQGDTDARWLSKPVYRGGEEAVFGHVFNMVIIKFIFWLGNRKSLNSP